MSLLSLADFILVLIYGSLEHNAQILYAHFPNSMKQNQILLNHLQRYSMLPMDQAQQQASMPSTPSL